jgi:hypothetical protein
MNNNFPDIYNYDEINPTIKSPNCVYELQFCQDRNSLMDIESYKKFLDNAISRFRSSRTYKHYKKYLIELGFDRCQVLGNLNNQMCTIEMHHNMITIYDIALIITEHVLNTKGRITTFDLVQLLKQEHKANRIPLIMLSLTPHQLYHNTQEFHVPMSMVFGNWPEFLQLYHTGITPDIAHKILFYLKHDIECSSLQDNELLNIRDNILDWSGYNECIRNPIFHSSMY